MPHRPSLLGDSGFWAREALPPDALSPRTREQNLGAGRTWGGHDGGFLPTAD